jgi:hypothetical protein
MTRLFLVLSFLQVFLLELYMHFSPMRATLSSYRILLDLLNLRPRTDTSNAVRIV